MGRGQSLPIGLPLAAGIHILTFLLLFLIFLVWGWGRGGCRSLLLNKTLTCVRVGLSLIRNIGSVMRYVVGNAYKKNPKREDRGEGLNVGVGVRGWKPKRGHRMQPLHDEHPHHVTTPPSPSLPTH